MQFIARFFNLVLPVPEVLDFEKFLMLLHGESPSVSIHINGFLKLRSSAHEFVSAA